MIVRWLISLFVVLLAWVHLVVVLLAWARYRGSAYVGSSRFMVLLAWILVDSWILSFLSVYMSYSEWPNGHCFEFPVATSGELFQI